MVGVFCLLAFGLFYCIYKCIKKNKSKRKKFKDSDENLYEVTSFVNDGHRFQHIEQLGPSERVTLEQVPNRSEDCPVEGEQTLVRRFTESVYNFLTEN